MIGIYKIVNPVGRVYIGQAVDINRRWNEHKRTNPSQFSRLSRSFSKYGINSHKFLIVEECSEQELNSRERYWQDHFDATGKNGLNSRLQQGDGKSGRLSKEMIEKRTETRRINGNFLVSEETILKRKTTIMTNGGYKRTPETLEKLKKPKGPQKRTQCPHCKKEGGVSNMVKYHFDNCLVYTKKTKHFTKSEEWKQQRRHKIGPYPTVTCPHCKKEGGLNVMNRWHFNNCKNKIDG